MITRVLTKISALALAAAALVIFLSPPASGYEISIFSILRVFWGLLLFSLVTTIVAGFFATWLTSRNLVPKLTLLLVIATVLVSATPILRGYFLYGSGDPIAHYQFTKNVLSTGFIQENPYPIVHLMAAISTTLFGGNINIAVQLVPVFGTSLFILGIYLLTRQLLTETHAFWAVATCTSLPFSYYHLAIYPQSMGVFALPLLFYFLLKTRQRRGKIVLLLLILFTTFAHPVTGVALIVFLFIVEGVSSYKNPHHEMKTTGGIWLFSLLIYLLWYIDTRQFEYGFRNVLVRILGHDASVPRSQEVEPALDQTVFELVMQVIKLFGSQLLVVSIAGLSGLYYLYRWFSNGEDSWVASQVVPFAIIGAIGGLVNLGLMIGTGFITFGRLLNLNIAYWVAPLLCAPLLVHGLRQFSLPSQLISRETARSAVLVIIVVMLITAVPLGVLSSYRAPWNGQPNWQTTYQDVAATDWAITYNGDNEIQALASVYSSKEISGAPPVRNETTHLLIGVERQGAVSVSISEPAYMGGWGLDNEMYQTIIENKHQKIYESSEMEIHMIQY